MVTSDLCFVSSKDLSHKFSVRYHVWRPRKLILGIFREIIPRSNTRKTPSRILAKLHQCGEHIHLILFIEVLDNTKKQRNLSPKKFPTFGKKWASASGLFPTPIVLSPPPPGLSSHTATFPTLSIHSKSYHHSLIIEDTFSIYLLHP